MKKVISLLLCLMVVLTPLAAVIPDAAAADTFYPQYNGYSDSIVDILASFGINYTFQHRAEIAKVNGITNYVGSAYQNLAMVELIKKGELKQAPAVPQPVVVTAQAGCFKPYSGPSVSIVDALKSLGYQSSYWYRSQIAAANNITNYQGTAWQNTVMLYLLRQGTLKVPVTTTATAEQTAAAGYFKAYTGCSDSIVDALKSMGYYSCYAYRATIAAANGITGYRGTANQNLTMLYMLKKGTLKLPN